MLCYARAPTARSDEVGHVMVQLSVVIPAFNEGARLPGTLRSLAAVGSGVTTPVVEIIVADDGSQASEVELEQRAVKEAAQLLSEAHSAHTVRLVRVAQNKGKGAAIRFGWQNASPQAAWLAFMDADGAINGEEFWRLARMLGSDSPFDLLAGSRIKMASRHIERSLLRHLQGRVFATLVERAFELGFYDTQCGLKFVRAPLLRERLADMKEDQWLFDIELLAALQRQGARFVEEPIDWADPGGSKVRPGIDAARMFFGLARIRRRLS